MPQIITVGILFFFTFRCSEVKGMLFPKGLFSVTTGLENDPGKLSSNHCKTCHKEIFANWKKSMHSRSWKDPLFVEAFKIEPRTWCVNCHAPLLIQKKEFESKKSNYPGEQTTGNLLDEGINCASCHVRDGKVLGGKNSFSPAHEVVRSDYLLSSDFCSDCHQFNFPRFKNKEIHYSKEPMQNTYTEWKRSGSERSCQNCHYDNHIVIGPHDKDWMRKLFFGFDYEITKGSLLSVSFNVEDIRAHNMPTGDLFHSLAFEVSSDLGFRKLNFQKKWGRFYKLGEIGPQTFWNRSLKKNTGIRFDEEKIHITCDISPNVPIYARLVYYYHDKELGGETTLPSEITELVIWKKKVR